MHVLYIAESVEELRINLLLSKFRLRAQSNVSAVLCAVLAMAVANKP